MGVPQKRVDAARLVKSDRRLSCPILAQTPRQRTPERLFAQLAAHLAQPLFRRVPVRQRELAERRERERGSVHINGKFRPHGASPFHLLTVYAGVG